MMILLASEMFKQRVIMGQEGADKYSLVRSIRQTPTLTQRTADTPHQERLIGRFLAFRLFMFSCTGLYRNDMVTAVLAVYTY